MYEKYKLIHKAGFASRSIPTYVGEWILYNFLGMENSPKNPEIESLHL
jgi:hypothetical protein